jgi:hypothetical protein
MKVNLESQLSKVINVGLIYVNSLKQWTASYFHDGGIFELDDFFDSESEVIAYILFNFFIIIIFFFSLLP